MPSGAAGTETEGGALRNVAMMPRPIAEHRVVKRIFVGNLPFRATESEVSELFGQYGTVLAVNLIIILYTLTAVFMMK